MTGPAELDEMGQDTGKLLMRFNMAFGALAEHDARRREKKAQHNAELDKAAAKAAIAKAAAAKQVADQKLRAVLQPAWAESVKGKDDQVVDAARAAIYYRGQIPVAVPALKKIEDHVQNEHGVHLAEWLPKLDKPIATDVEDAQLNPPAKGNDSPVHAAGTAEALSRQDRAEDRAGVAQGQAKQSAAEADKASAEAREAEANAGLSRLPASAPAAETSRAATPVQTARSMKLAPGAASTVTPGFARALRVGRAAFPGAGKPTVSRATAPKARKGRGTGPSQGRTHGLGM